MGISGISPQMGASSSGPSGITSPFLKSPAIQTVLHGLGLNPNALHATKMPGVVLKNPIADTLAGIQVVQPTSGQLEALRPMGLEQVQMALIVSDESQSRRVRERLSEVARSITDRDALVQLSIIFDLDVQDAVVDDNGAMILFSGLSEINQSIEEE